VYVISSIAKYCKHIVTDSQIGVFLQIPAHIFNSDKDFIFGGVYIPPDYSPWYDDKSDSNGIELLEKDLFQAYQVCDDSSVLLLGDFNARTGILPDYILDDSADNLPCKDWYSTENFDVSRNSCDHNGINNFGKCLISLCEAYSIHFANGRTPGDLQGNYTCLTYNGCSVVDYCLMSTDLFKHMSRFEVHHEAVTGSVHLPIIATFEHHVPHVQTTTKRHTLNERLSYVWSAEEVIPFRLRLYNSLPEGETFTCVSHTDIDSAAGLLTDALQTAAKPLRRSHITQTLCDESNHPGGTSIYSI
jgi:hypothetical protein